MFHATTIFAIQHNGQSAMSGDGQVTFGNQVIMKKSAKKYGASMVAKSLPDLLEVSRTRSHSLKNSKRSLKCITGTYNGQQLSWQRNGEAIRCCVN